MTPLTKQQQMDVDRIVHAHKMAQGISLTPDARRILQAGRAGSREAPLGEPQRHHDSPRTKLEPAPESIPAPSGTVALPGRTGWFLCRTQADVSAAAGSAGVEVGRILVSATLPSWCRVLRPDESATRLQPTTGGGEPIPSKAEAFARREAVRAAAARAAEAA